MLSYVDKKKKDNENLSEEMETKIMFFRMTFSSL